MRDLSAKQLRDVNTPRASEFGLPEIHREQVLRLLDALLHGIRNMEWLLLRLDGHPGPVSTCHLKESVRFSLCPERAWIFRREAVEGFRHALKKHLEALQSTYIARLACRSLEPTQATELRDKTRYCALIDTCPGYSGF